MILAEQSLWDEPAAIKRPSPWTPERVELLKKLWANGDSCSRIADQIGDVTRNAVIGKVNRLGLSYRVTVYKAARFRGQDKKPRQRVKPATVRSSALAELFEVAVDLPPATEERTDASCSLFDLTDKSCRWPCGDPRSAEFFFCGQPKSGGFPYCAGHARVAYRPDRNFSDAGRAACARNIRKVNGRQVAA